MPELPEVQTVVSELNQVLIGKEIAEITTTFPRMLNNQQTYFQQQLKQQKIIGVERFGKYILICLSNNEVIRVHLRMEGKFYLTTKLNDNSIDKHVHVIIKFTDGHYLKYHDVRKFGTFELISYQTDWHDDEKFMTLGYEPWEAKCTVAFIYQALQKSKMAIKPALLTQKIIVGLGNIYVDEVLFLAKIHPSTPAFAVTKHQVGKIKRYASEVMQKAIKLGGSTIRTYHNTLGIDGLFQNELVVHLRKNLPCVNCQTIIEKTKVGGRGTYICPRCQRLKIKEEV